jgi:hypothetical protein
MAPFTSVVPYVANASVVAGVRQARQDLPHDPCRGRANKRTDPKDDGVQRLRISHLYYGKEDS